MLATPSPRWRNVHLERALLRPSTPPELIFLKPALYLPPPYSLLRTRRASYTGNATIAYTNTATSPSVAACCRGRLRQGERTVSRLTLREATLTLMPRCVAYRCIWAWLAGISFWAPRARIPNFAL